jgi:hypothetical protein
MNKTLPRQRNGKELLRRPEDRWEDKTKRVLTEGKGTGKADWLRYEGIYRAAGLHSHSSLTPNIRWSLVFNFTPRSLYPGKKPPVNIGPNVPMFPDSKGHSMPQVERSNTV